MKNKIIISSILTIARCFSLIAGSTFALFTSESNVNVAVTSGTVDVDVDASALTLGSTLGTALGTAELKENVITLTNLVPGDYVTFTLTITNKSNVTVNYRALVKTVEDKGLLDGLVITYNNAFASDWKKLEPTTANVAEVVVTISLPEDASNDYQNTSCKLAYVVEAVQGNVEIVDGIEYRTDENGQKVLYDVFGETPSVVTVPEGVEVIGNWSLYDATFEAINLPSTLKTIGSRAFKGNTALKSVTIPAGTETIVEGAFQQSSLESATINGGSIGKQAFGYISTLETVILGENVSYVENYAFRGCASLKTVVILNENIEFGGTSMAFSNAESGKSDNITIYVPNDAVAAKVKAANGSCTGYKIVVGDPVVENDTEIDEAIKDGVTTLILGSGNYIIPDSANDKTLTIIGNGDTVIATQDDGSYEGCDYSLRGATVTFENVTINTDSRTYTGYAGLKATYNNCTINGTYTLYDDSTFNNCTFNVSGDVYNIWTWGATNATFNNCTFNSDGKAILLYGGTDTNLTLNGCTFNDKGGLTDKKAAVEIGDDYKKNFTLTVTNTVVNGYEINDKGINTGTTLWGNKNSMSADRLTVIVDGVKVYGN